MYSVYTVCGCCASHSVVSTTVYLFSYRSARRDSRIHQGENITIVHSVRTNVILCSYKTLFVADY